MQRVRPGLRKAKAEGKGQRHASFASFAIGAAFGADMRRAGERARPGKKTHDSEKQASVGGFLFAPNGGEVHIYVYAHKAQVSLGGDGRRQHGVHVHECRVIRCVYPL